MNTKKITLVTGAILLSCILANAQPMLKLVAPSVVLPGTIVNASIQLTGSSNNIVAIEDTVTFAPVFQATLVGNPAVSNKNQVCTPPNQLTCVYIGMIPAAVVDHGTSMIASDAVFNSDPIPDGSTVQLIRFTAPATVGIVQIDVNGVFAADASGNGVPINGSHITINVASPLSLVQSALDAWVANPTQANFLALMAAQIQVQLSIGK